MATIEKIKKKKGKVVAQTVRDERNPDQDSKIGSVISVREAQEDAKSDTVQVVQVYSYKKRRQQMKIQICVIP